MVQSLSACSMLGEQVRWIDLAVHLAQVNAACPDSLLDPQSVCIEVPQFAQPLA